MESIDKRALLEAFRARLEQDLGTLERRQADTQAGATHAENRAEHAKDTRATEDSYLARGLADRVEDLRRSVDALAGLDARHFAEGEGVAVGALVSLAVEDATGGMTRERWLVLPGAAGLEVETRGGRVRSVTPVSPLGRALLGLQVGDEGAYRTPAGERRFEVVGLA